MRVALVHMRHAGTGGTEKVLNALAAELGTRGHAVEIVCRSFEPRAAPPGARFVRLRPLALGGAWRMVAFARAVERRCTRASYDLVFGLGKTWTHDVVRLGGGCQQTYLEQAHAASLAPWERLVGWGALKQRAALAIERRALAPGAYRRVVVNSRMVAADVERRHAVPRERVDVVPNGVDLERFHGRRRADERAALRRELALEAGDFAVLFLGTGYGRKGLDLVLDGWRELAGRVPRARLVVAGYDGAAARWETRAAALGIDARFLGGRRDPERLYAAADVYALPTRYDPFANTTLEALASGLPVVTTLANGGADVLEDGVHGSVLAAAPAPEEVAAAIARWADPERRAAAGLAARARAEDYPERGMARRLAEIAEAVAPKAGTANAGTA
jgi:UDP-glucose:(heptosyl)LPS alpha-1,3-glucosyltransferase